MTYKPVGVDQNSEFPPRVEQRLAALFGGRAIVSIERTFGDGSPGTTDTYTITYSDDTTSAFGVHQGADGTGGGGGGVTSYSALTDKPFIPSTPGDIGAATAAQGAKADSAVQPAALTAYAPKASPTFTGTVSGITADMVGAAATNDPRFAPANINASIITETAPGVWSADAPARSGGGQPVLFVGADDPADVNGVATPANIRPYDTWLKQV